MRTRGMIGLGLAAVALAGAVALACSSSSSSAPSDAGADGGLCTTAPNEAACKTTGACLRCCSCFHPSGVATFNNALEQCVCAPSACQSACASSICASPPKASTAGDPCNTCVAAAIGADGGCNQPINTACNANPDCVALLACTNGPAGDGDGGCP